MTTYYYLHCEVWLREYDGMWILVGAGTIDYCNHIMNYSPYKNREMMSTVWGYIGVDR